MPKKPIDLIVALDKNNGIGKDGTIPWHIPEDLKRFSRLTRTTTDPDKHNAVIMGRKTWESLPEKFRPLPNRTNVVLTLSDSEFPGATAVHSFCDALGFVDHNPAVERIFVIGGAAVYKNAIKYADSIYVTALDIEVVCDVFFPIIGPEFALSAWEAMHHHCGIDFEYLRYRRRTSL